MCGIRQQVWHAAVGSAWWARLGGDLPGDLVGAHLSKAELARVSGRSIFSLLGWGSSPVRHTGGSRRLCLKPKKAPQKTRGTEMQNHMQMSAMIVPKGTAPDEPRPQMKKLRKSAPGGG